MQSLKDWGLVRRRRRSLLKDDNSSLEEDTVSQAERRLPVEACLLFGCVGMFFALLLMYKLTEGSRHLVTFMAGEGGLAGVMEENSLRRGRQIAALEGVKIFKNILRQTAADAESSGQPIEQLPGG